MFGFVDLLAMSHTDGFFPLFGSNCSRQLCKI
jgi:hypothetical protein